MKFFYKKDNCLVECYDMPCAANNDTALIFSPSLAGRQNGNGWIRVRMKYLIPEEYSRPWSNDFVSNELDETIKKRILNVIMEDYVYFVCSDQVKFGDYIEAQRHEYKLYKEEKENAK